MPVYAAEQKEHTLDSAANSIAARSQLKQQLLTETLHQQTTSSSSTITSSTSSTVDADSDDVVVDEEQVNPVDDVDDNDSVAQRGGCGNAGSSSFEDDETMGASNTSTTTTPLVETNENEKPLNVPGDATSSTTSSTSSPVEVADSNNNNNTTNSTCTSKEAAEHHVIIFDWDDTLLASSFLASNGYRLDMDLEACENYSFVQNELQMLENCVVNILEEALQRGKVHIITNAENGWVEMSARKFLPGVLPYLNRVQVLSARSTYEHLFPDSPMKWKYCAMQERLSHLINHEGSRKNIISFGDSYVEREAVRAVTRGAANTRTKSIKFAECPNTEQLRKQLELVANCFHYIFTHDGDLDLMLKMSMVPANNNTTTNNAGTANA